MSGHRRKTLKPPGVGTLRKPVCDWGEDPGVPARQTWLVRWPSHLVLWVGGLGMGRGAKGELSVVSQSGAAFQL